MDLPKCSVEYTVCAVQQQSGSTGYCIELVSNVYAAFVELDFDDADVIFQIIILILQIKNRNMYISIKKIS